MSRTTHLAALATGWAMIFASAPAVSAEEVPASASGPFGAGTQVGDGALGAIAGMADIQLEEQIASAKNSSIVAGNSVNGLSFTGEVSIDGQSFQNMAGLSILTANTGNNVSVNAAMNVNVSFHQ